MNIFLSYGFELDRINTLNELNEITGETEYVPQFTSSALELHAKDDAAEHELIFELPSSNRCRLYIHGPNHYITQKHFPGAPMSLHPTIFPIVADQLKK